MQVNPSAVNSKTQTWAIDLAHSKIEFSVSHMVISHVKGYFKNFEGHIKTLGDNFENAQVEVSIDSNSIDTNNEQRDNHLRSTEFIDASNFPSITFKSTSVRKINDKTFIITGDFTLRGVTKKIELTAKYNGSVKDNNGMRAGYKVMGEIDRKDFDVNWSAKLETGALIAGNIVEFTGYIEITRS